MLKVTDLEKACVNHNLTELLKLVSDDELLKLRTYVECDDIIGIRINIMDAICTEMESRQINMAQILRRK